MVQRVSTVAFEGIEARAVDVQVQVAPGLPAFNKVYLLNLSGARTYVSRKCRPPQAFGQRLIRTFGCPQTDN